MNKKYKYLDLINFPSDIKKLTQSELRKLADEVREELIDAVSETGGHLGAGLGVVELTVALHYIFIICLGALRIAFFIMIYVCLFVLKVNK